MALNLKTLATRALSALFFVIILMGCIYFSYLSFVLLFFLVCLLGLHEYYKLAVKLGAQPSRVIGFFFAILLFGYFSIPRVFSYFSVPDGGLIRLLFANGLILFPAAVLIKALFSQSPSNLANAMHTFMGVFYAVFPMALLVTIPVTWQITGLQYDYFKVLGIVFLIWCNDTLAYLGGSLFGTHKMFERISPGKTWEGTLTGALGAIGLGFVLNLNHTYEHSFVWPCIALLVAVFGTIGDLVESMLKRLAGVKDSGQLMPGHGGALDRFDSLIFVTPFVYAFLKVLLLI